MKHDSPIKKLVDKYFASHPQVRFIYLCYNRRCSYVTTKLAAACSSCHWLLNPKPFVNSDIVEAVDPDRVEVTE